MSFYLNIVRKNIVCDYTTICAKINWKSVFESF